MRFHKALFMLAVVWLAVHSAHAATLYVATTGDDASGDGTAGNPYRTINFASSIALDGDTIRVMPGTYAECVDVSGFAVGAPRSVFLVADDWITSQDNTASIRLLGKLEFVFERLLKVPDDEAEIRVFASEAPEPEASRGQGDR